MLRSTRRLDGDDTETCETDPCTQTNCPDGRYCDPRSGICEPDVCTVVTCPNDGSGKLSSASCIPLIEDLSQPSALAVGDLDGDFLRDAEEHDLGRGIEAWLNVLDCGLGLEAADPRA